MRGPAFAAIGGVFALLALGSCDTPGAAADDGRAAQCRADGGRMVANPFDGPQLCFQSFPDAGQACRAAPDCQGMCIAGAPGTGGQCAAQTILDPCGLDVFDNEGRRIPGICI